MEYRSFIHRPERLISAAEQEGVRATWANDGGLWRIVGFERPT
jgi:hypothetical protein